MRWQWLDGLDPSPLAEAVRAGDGPLLPFYRHTPWDLAAGTAGRLPEVDRETFRAPREEVAQALLRFQRSLGASPAQLRETERLRDPRTVVVVTGQQVGAGASPLYVLYKALLVRQLAEALERITGRPVVPVFWLASEDHDLLEVNHLWWPKSGGGLQKVAYGTAVDGQRVPVGRIPAAPAAADLVAQLRELPAAGEYQEQILRLLVDTAEGSLSDWMGRLLLRLLPRPPVLLSPLEPDLRRLALPFWERVAGELSSLPDAVQQGARRVEESGFPLQVNPARSALFFWLHEGQRCPLAPTSRGVGGAPFPAGAGPADLLRAIGEDPLAPSAGVLLRPLLQDYLLPTLTYLGGSAEVSYMALLGPLYEVLGMTQPIIRPRPHLTLIEGTVERLLGRYGLPLLPSSGELAEVRRQALEEREGIGIVEAFSAFEARMAEETTRLKQVLSPLGTDLARQIDETAGRTRSFWEKIEKRAEKAHRDSQEGLLGHFARLEGALRPEGLAQERILGPLPLLARHGLGLVDDLDRVPLWEARRHGVVFIGHDRREPHHP